MGDIKFFIMLLNSKNQAAVKKVNGHKENK